ncbi:MAG TPA: hypothetical protein VN034_07560 [Sphingopyxis sp.]|nr:hypothetical protein [Sphingopyxis sp.]
MERRTLMGGLLMASGFVGVSRLGAERQPCDDDGNENALWRLQNARSFFPNREFACPGDLFYQLGIVSQLALTACVIADGWSDEDCRRRIGQDVGKAHFYAKAKGLHFNSDRFARLAPLLSPYGRWRSPATGDVVDVGKINAAEAKSAVLQLLIAVRSHLVGAEGRAPSR